MSERLVGSVKSFHGSTVELYGGEKFVLDLDRNLSVGREYAFEFSGDVANRAFLRAPVTKPTFGQSSCWVRQLSYEEHLWLCEPELLNAVLDEFGHDFFEPSFSIPTSRFEGLPNKVQEHAELLFRFAQLPGVQKVFVEHDVAVPLDRLEL